MKNKQIKDMGASVRARLLDMAKKTGRDFDAVLVRYFQERFLYRLSRSPYERHFILKGALLFLVYEMPFFRPTKDIDFLGSATSNDMGNIKSMIREIAGLHLPDGVIFYPDSVKAERIKEDADYEGVRVKLEATLSGARKTLQLDIGFGDIVVPGPVEMEFPVLLEGLPVPSLMVYSKESAVAEKFEALVKLNFLTSRMKDVYDILFLALHESFSLATMSEAILATFRRRLTPLGDRKVIFGGEFKNQKEKQEQWSAFLKRNRLESDEAFSATVEKIELFLDPACGLDAPRKDDQIWNSETWKWESLTIRA